MRKPIFTVLVPCASTMVALGLPDRRDFHHFRGAPEERMRRWREAEARSEQLARQFLDDLRSGRLVERVQAMG